MSPSHAKGLPSSEELSEKDDRKLGRIKRFADLRKLRKDIGGQVRRGSPKNLR